MNNGRVKKRSPALFEEGHKKEAVFRRTIIRWGGRNSRSFPWRDKADLYSVVVGEVLLQRTRGEHVVDVYDSFLRRWPDAEALAKARVTSIANVIRPLGLSKRASILKQLGVALVERGSVPADPDELIELPGLGPYAAHSVPIFAGGKNLPLVDWVIARVLRRYFGFPEGRRPNADPDLWALATRLVRSGRARDLWLGTLDFGARVCSPRPKCPVCPLNPSCSLFARKNLAEV